MKPKQYKCRHVSCSCTEEEYRIVHGKAKAAGVSVSEYLRTQLPEGVWRPPQAAGPPAGKSG